MNVRNSSTSAVNRLPRRRGVALLLVVVVLALAAVLGFAMLSSASIRAVASSNSLKSASAEGLAESGIELACYYLVNPQKAPAPVPAGGFWSGADGITLGAAVPGTIDVAVTQLSSNKYKIVSTGKAESNIKRTMTAEVEVAGGFQVNHAVAFSGAANTSATTKIYGDVLAKDLLTNLGLIDGVLYIGSLPLGSGTIGAVLGLDSSPVTHIPTSATVRTYATYTYNGSTYSAKAITTVAAGATLGPTPDNPAGVFIGKQPLYLGNSTRIHGTLVMDPGMALNINGSNIEIKPADGFPGLVLKSDLIFRGPGGSRNMRVEGLSWVGGNIKSSGLLLTNCFVEFDGAVLFGGGGSVDPLLTAGVTVKWNPSRFNGVVLDVATPPSGVKVTSFK